MTAYKEDTVSKITITIETGNSAFADDSLGEQGEVSRILRHLANIFRDYGLETQTVRDLNGNTVGKVEVS